MRPQNLKLIIVLRMKNREGLISDMQLVIFNSTNVTTAVFHAVLVHLVCCTLLWL